MKFLDPLSSLKFMGGAVSIHSSMAVYAYFSYYKGYKLIRNCSSGDPDKYFDVALMFYSHLICIVLYIMKLCNSLDKDTIKDWTDSTIYMQSMTQVLSIGCYMIPILLM